MPNLETMMNDEAELRRSLDRMLTGQDYVRTEVRCNHGIRTPEELQALMCQPPMAARGDQDLAAAFEVMHG